MFRINLKYVDFNLVFESRWNLSMKYYCWFCGNGETPKFYILFFIYFQKGGTDFWKRLLFVIALCMHNYNTSLTQKEKSNFDCNLLLFCGNRTYYKPEIVKDNGHLLHLVVKQTNSVIESSFELSPQNQFDQVTVNLCGNDYNY